MVEENPEVISATSSEGETSFMVCRTDKERRQKVCMDVGAEASKTLVSSEGMLDNNVYNLIEQLTIENKSLWRIKNNYKTDAVQDKEATDLWDLIEKDKEELVGLLTEKLRERI